MEPRKEPLDLTPLLRRTVDRFRLLPGGVSVELCSGELPTIDADETQIEQVVSNLLDNAVRHSLDGTPVTVTTSCDDTSVHFEVADRGPGVSPEESELIFQPFRSGALAGSSGVGLAISRAIVERHGGTISVDERPGGGARFAVSLPRR
jgi:signal transduction histidine kinase